MQVRLERVAMKVVAAAQFEPLVCPSMGALDSELQYDHLRRCRMACVGLHYRPLPCGIRARLVGRETCASSLHPFAFPPPSRALVLVAVLLPSWR